MRTTASARAAPQRVRAAGVQVQELLDLVEGDPGLVRQFARPHELIISPVPDYGVKSSDPRPTLELESKHLGFDRVEVSDEHAARQSASAGEHELVSQRQSASGSST